ncbi:MAG: diguanylate cyclase [Burkholderiales bacterium]|nr:diguanylate cyclase [Burkholderiales bacterium]MDR4518836.1 diguanylate cyclase [Nitrosomonas sp.]
MTQSNNIAPSIIARETLLKLGSLKLQPTPDNYHKIYDEIAGVPVNQMPVSTTRMLAMFANDFPRHTQELSRFANMLEQAVKNRNWNEYKAVLMKMAGLVGDLDKHDSLSSRAAPVDKILWTETIATLLKKLDKNHGQVTAARKREGLNRVLANSSLDSFELQKKLNALVASWDVLATEANESIEVGNTDDSMRAEASTDTIDEETESIAVQHAQNSVSADGMADEIKALLVQMLEQVAFIQSDDTVLGSDVKRLAQSVHYIQSKQELEQFATDFKKFLEKFEYCGNDNEKLQQRLLKLMDRLLDSTGEFLSEDEWIRNHVSKLRRTIAQPLDKRLLAEAESYLEAIIQRQEIIKRGLGDAKNTLKEMATCLIGNIEELSDETGEYHKKIESYSEQISQTEDLEALNQLLVEVMKDTRQMQESTQGYRDGFIAARAEVEIAQEKIVQLESEILQMNEKIHEDHLTGVLNRRGLDLVFDREVARAKRQQQPVCYALLDVDNFKALNDTYGHKAGDEALVYLVNAVKNVTRSDDVVARYGGEEFVVLLPNTQLKEAVEVLSRVRRDLTKKFFLHENKKVLITFSAGVAEYKSGELQDNIFKRADEALYRAKKNGKNLILEAA